MTYTLLVIIWLSDKEYHSAHAIYYAGACGLGDPHLQKNNISKKLYRNHICEGGEEGRYQPRVMGSPRNVKNQPIAAKLCKLI